MATRKLMVDGDCKAHFWLRPSTFRTPEARFEPWFRENLKLEFKWCVSDGVLAALAHETTGPITSYPEGVNARFFVMAFVFLVLTATAQRTIGQSGTPGLELRRLEFEGTRFEVVTLDLRRASLEMQWKDAKGQPYKTFQRLEMELSRSNRRVLAAMNAGIFDTSFRPLGLHIQQGRVLRDLNTRQRGYGNFYLQPNGVFMIGPNGARVLPTSAYQREQPRVLEATQSGPMLVVNGKLHPAFRQGSENQIVRNGVGVESANRVHLVLAVDPVNFYDFARFMRDGLNCPNALYLDGNISSLNVPGTEVIGDGEFAGMLTVVAQ
jgi:uncharacterized protein YigE (DUF2233 family)